MAPGHMLPAIDMAKLFATRGITSIIVNTHANDYNEAFIAKTIEIETQKSDIKVNLLTMKFPSRVHNLIHYEPYKKLSSDAEAFIVPGDLPHEIKLTKSKLPPYDKSEEKVMGMKLWHIGPFSLGYIQGDKGADRKGKKSSIDVSESKQWLDEKETDLLIYICLGSMSNVSDAQLHEIAIVLDNLSQNFILVVRKEDTNEWIPHGFETRIKERGFIIRGWAPQPMILDHQSVGGFMTHYGWNSILERVVAGVPMVTWPFHAEQFYNEKLITDVLKIGIQVGAKKLVPRTGNHKIFISNKDIEGDEKGNDG
ncbi:Scopoletin glucosyltransferase [Bienertia sinuspersici]